MSKFPYKWKLSDGYTNGHGCKVFSCFACGGGSSMGYKLAGYDVIGAMDIDPRMAKLYIANHHPKYFFTQGIVEFKDSNLPSELFDLDVLDGSPPCSTFCASGDKAEGFGKEKVFKEGQESQVLDTLFFDFIDLAKRLRPKVVIAENVKGLLYCYSQNHLRKIISDFDDAGYYVQYFLLDGSKMGLPQKRQRVFFIAIRKDLAKTTTDLVGNKLCVPLNMHFNEKKIPFSKVYHNYCDFPLYKGYITLWNGRKLGDSSLCDEHERRTGKRAHFNHMYVYKHKVALTLTAKCENVLFDEARLLNFDELCEIGSYPKDYDFCSYKPSYSIGMSVPPVMWLKWHQEYMTKFYIPYIQQNTTLNENI